MSGYRTRNRHHVLTLEGKIIPGDFHCIAYGTPITDSGYFVFTGAMPNYPVSFDYDLSAELDVSASIGYCLNGYTINATGGSMTFYNYRDYSMQITGGWSTAFQPTLFAGGGDSNGSLVPIANAYRITTSTNGLTNFVDFHTGYSATRDMILFTQKMEPTPGAYTYPAGTNVNMFHHSGVKPINTVTVAASSTYSNTNSTRSTIYSCTMTHTYSIDVYYITSPFDRPKTLAGMCSAAGVSYSTSGVATYETADSRAQAMYEYVLGFQSSGKLIKGGSDGGIVLSSSSTIYGCLIICKYLSSRMIGSSDMICLGDGASNSTPAPSLNATTTVDGLRATLGSRSTIPDWVTQTPY